MTARDEEACSLTLRRREPADDRCAVRTRHKALQWEVDLRAWSTRSSRTTSRERPKPAGNAPGKRSDGSRRKSPAAPTSNRACAFS